MIAFLFTTTVVSAQSIILKGGLTLANIAESGELDLEDKTSKPGFQAGIMFDKPLTENISLRTGALYTLKGFAEKMSEDDYNLEMSLNMNYIDIPLEFVYKTPVNNAQFLLSAGPYLGIGLNANLRFKEEYMGETYEESESIQFGSEDEVLNRFEGGVRIGTGIQYNHVQFELNYSRGLTNIIYEAEEDEIFNYYLGFSLGYAIEFI
jgi:hypothetical protein